MTQENQLIKKKLMLDSIFDSLNKMDPKIVEEWATKEKLPVEKVLRSLDHVKQQCLDDNDF